MTFCGIAITLCFLQIIFTDNYPYLSSGHGTVRSYRHMDGWGVHTFRFVTETGASKLVKFRLRTLQGKASLLWEEAQIISGKNADFHRQDLWDSIEAGEFPEYEVLIPLFFDDCRLATYTVFLESGQLADIIQFEVQILEEEDQLKYGFDVLDPTKIVPEDLVPFKPLGKLTLNRNPRNYFAETEQVMVRHQC